MSTLPNVVPNTSRQDIALASFTAIGGGGTPPIPPDFDPTDPKWGGLYIEQSDKEAFGQFNAPTLDWNPATRQWDSAFGPTPEYARAGEATYFDENGDLQVAAANEPRMTTETTENAGVITGATCEPDSENLFLNSQTPANQTVVVGAGDYAVSFYGTGTVTVGGVVSDTIVGNGAFPVRTFKKFTTTAGPLILNLSGDVQDMQVELGEVPTSFIITDGSTAPRSADQIKIDDATGIFTNADEACVYMEFWSREYYSPNTRIMLEGESSNRRFGYINPGEGDLKFYDGANINTYPVISPSNELTRYFVSLTPGTADLSANGTETTGQPTSGTLQQSTALNIGMDNSGVAQLNGIITRVIVWPEQQSDLE